MADQAKALASGRKFYVVKWLIAIFIYLSAAMIALAAFGKEVPQALGFAAGVDISGIVGYIGVNVWQKKVQGSQLQEATTMPVGG